jgi:hypothetical protein
MAKTTVKIKDLVQRTRSIAISDDEQIMVRALNLHEMVTLFIDSKDLFLPLYVAGIDGDLTAEALAPFLLTAPELVARIIALASDEPESAPIIQSHMPATVQLIALFEVWKASVPDPKKARSLLSEVTALLQKVMEKGAEENRETPKTLSQTTLPPESNTLSPTGTD